MLFVTGIYLLVNLFLISAIYFQDSEEKKQS